MDYEILDEFEVLPERPRTLQLKCDILFSKEGVAAHQYFCIYPNGVLIVGVTEQHPIVQKGRVHEQIEISLDSEELWNVSEKGEKAKKINFTNHDLCRVKIADEIYRVNHPRDTRLMNFNQRLKTHPELLYQRCQWEGHVAVLWAPNRTISRMKRWYCSATEYAEFHSINETDLMILRTRMSHQIQYNNPFIKEVNLATIVCDCDIIGVSKELRLGKEETGDVALMSFFNRIINHLVNQVLVDTLTNSRIFQRFAVRSNEAFKEFAKKGGVNMEQASEFGKAFAAEMRKNFVKENQTSAKPIRDRIP
eukprot:g1975.t1